MLRAPCTSGQPSQRMQGITAATPAVRWAGTSKPSPWSLLVPAPCWPAASREGLGLSITSPRCPLAASWGLAACELGDGAVCDGGGLGGQLPGLQGPLGVSGTTHSTSGSHRSHVSPCGTEPPTILEVTPSMKALVGEDVILECWVSGVPPPHIAWYKGETGTDLGSKPAPCTGGSAALQGHRRQGLLDRRREGPPEALGC